jgi:3-deoxy-D-arabino-heptulosonate 7-phosphate (DAHP) synthase class II
MTYRVQTDWGSDANWNQQRIGLELELHATASPDAEAALREVAEWALPERTDVCITVDEPMGRVQRASGPDGWVVELTAHVLHCGDVRRAVDDAQQDFVREVKHRLSSAGVKEE